MKSNLICFLSWSFTFSIASQFPNYTSESLNTFQIMAFLYWTSIPLIISHIPNNNQDLWGRQILKLNLSIAILPKLAKRFQIYEEPCILLAVTPKWNHLSHKGWRKHPGKNRTKGKFNSTEVQKWYKFEGTFKRGKHMGFTARPRKLLSGRRKHISQGGHCRT